MQGRQGRGARLKGTGAAAINSLAEPRLLEKAWLREATRFASHAPISKVIYYAARCSLKWFNPLSACINDERETLS